MKWASRQLTSASSNDGAMLVRAKTEGWREAREETADVAELLLVAGNVKEDASCADVAPITPAPAMLTWETQQDHVSIIMHGDISHCRESLMN